MGYAQQCLNRFLARHQAGQHNCAAASPGALRFVARAVSTLRTRGQLPLVVDCRFGASTQLATKAFQACAGIMPSGKIGSVTWPRLEAFAPGSGPSGPAPAFRLLVDAHRNGSLVPAPPRWQWGRGGTGAVVLVNNDDDGVNGRADNRDARVDAGDDVDEVVTLALDPVTPGPPPSGTQVELEVSDRDAVRIFDRRGRGGSEIMGPSTADTHRFASPPTSRLELGMEAVRYAGSGFDGEVTITLRTTSPAGVVDSTSTTVRVAPWVIPNHLDRAERVFVVDAGSFNSRFRRDLSAAVSAAGCTLSQFSSGDIWMQDCMELGWSSLPSKTLRTVLRAPRDRPLRAFPPSLLDADLGVALEGSLSPFTTFDSTGNLEATPPVTSTAGKRYPFGRIYFGPGLPAEPFDAEVGAFLRAQAVQEPIAVDTAWLTVGHVDEAISFAPSTRGKGFVMLLASPERAYEILDSLAATHPGAKMLVGRSFPVSRPPGRASVETTVSAFLSARDDFHPELRAAVAAGLVAHTPGPLRHFNRRAQGRIDGIRRQMKTELGLDEIDVVDVPSLFMPSPFAPDLADAVTAGMVNMLVLNGHAVVPKPFGPVVGGVDRFEEDVRDNLTALGVTVHVIDCWDEYHVNLGEVHCATNTLRTPPAATKWWEFQP